MAATTTNHFDLYLRLREDLADVIRRQLGVLDALKLDEQRKDGTKPGATLKTVAGRVASEDLKILIMGGFNAGKSTLINALLGAKILPAKMLPTTAIINEIRYAPEGRKRIVIHPKPGRWKGGDAPFEIPIDELDRYVTIDHGSGGKPPSSPFDRVEIYWPLALCVNKVEIIDSPGLNDPDSHDRITLEYLPKADAIIYCMPCEQACTRTDMDTIAMLRNQGYTSLLFLLTKFDRVRETSLLNGSNEDKEFVRVTVDHLQDLTDLGRAGIFFVDSLHALSAKAAGDRAALDNTRFPELERGLEEYLVQNRFRAKLVKAITQVRTTNVDAQATIDDRLSLANTSQRDLQERFRKAQEPLAQLKQRSELILGRVEAGLTDILRGVSDRARAYLVGCPGKVPAWIEEYEPTGSVSWNPLRIRESVEALADEYLAHARARLEIESSAWAKEDLVPWIEAELARLVRSLETQAVDYEKALRQLRLDLNFADATSGLAIAEGENPSTMSKLGGILYGILTHDWLNAGMVSVFGVRGLLRGLGAQLVVGIALGVVSLFHPIGWATLVGGLVIAATTGVVSNYISINARVRSKVTAAVEESLRDGGRQLEMARGIERQVETQLRQVLDAMRRATLDDIGNIEAEVQKALADKRQGEARVEQEKSLLTRASEANRAVASAIFDLAVETNVSR